MGSRHKAQSLTMQAIIHINSITPYSSLQGTVGTHSLVLWKRMSFLEKSFCFDLGFEWPERGIGEEGAEGEGRGEEILCSNLKLCFISVQCI